MGLRVPELRPRQPFLGLAIAAVLGIWLADLHEVNAWLVLAATLLAAAPLLPWSRSSWLCCGFVFVAFFTLHTVRHYGSAAHLLANEFADGRHVVTARGIVWSEPSKPQQWSRTTTCHFILKVESLEAGGVRRQVPALVEAQWAGPPPVYGDRVSILGSARNLPPPSNPGQVDFTTYRQRHGIYSHIQARYAMDCRIESHGHGSSWQYAANNATAAIRKTLELDLADEPDISALIESMVLGVHGETLDETKIYFQQTGTMHLFAVSGLNVAMLALIAMFVLKPFGVSRRVAFFILAPTLLGYALVTGWGASCIRACIMGGLVLGSYLVDRPAAPFNSMAAAAVLILAWDTEQLFSPGFQFSFALVIVLMLIATRMHERVLPYGMPDPFLPRVLWTWRHRAREWAWRSASGNLCVSVAAWGGSLLFTAGYFHLFSISTVAANLIAVPIAFLMLALGIASVITGWGVPSLAAIFNNANWALAKTLLASVKFFAAVPGGHTYVEMPAFRGTPACEITVLDVGAGGANFIRTPHARWLIDCGHNFEYQRAVLPFLRSRGVNKLDGLLLTHGDAQHIGAVAAALEDFPSAVLVDSPLKDRSSTRRKLHTDLAEAGRPKRICERGDVIHLAHDATLRVLFPPTGLVRSVADDKTFVLLLESAGTRVLFTSDSGFATEQWLLANEPDLHADILIKGRHAKDLSGTPDFLNRVAPQIIVVSGPEYGASADANAEWARTVTDRGMTLFQSDTAGAVTIGLRDGEISATAFLSGQTFRSRAR